MQPLLRARTATGTVGRKTEAFPKRPSAEVFAQPLVPLRVSCFFHDHVWFDAVQHIQGVHRRAAAADCHAALGIQAALAMGRGRYGLPVDRTIRFWILQRYAHLYRTRFCDHGPVPAKVLVCVLPHGDDDAGDLYPQTRKRGGCTWKKKPRRSRSC